MLSKLSVPGRPTSLDDSRVRAYCACSRCGRGLFGHFLSHLSFLFSFSLSTTNQPMSYRNFVPYSNWHHSLKGSLGETSCVPVSGLLTVWMDALVAILRLFQ